MKPMKQLPDKGNPFYNTTEVGGYSWCIQGKPTQDGLNVLDNCVGFCCARFNQIYSEITGFVGMKYPQLNCNAENFIERAKKIGLTYQEKPCLGGIMVWEGISNKNAGHVASVEEVIDDNTVFTAESGYNHFAFENFTRTNDNGNWSLNSNFKYLGCIINPANPQPEPTPTPPTPTPYPFDGVVKKGSTLYTISGNPYKNKTQRDRAVEVMGEANGRYKVYGDTFNPHIVYCNKSDVIKQGIIYPFNAVIVKGSTLYTANGKAYPSKVKKDRNVVVQGELNGKYQIYGSTFNPHVVYCDKSSIRR